MCYLLAQSAGVDAIRRKLRTFLHGTDCFKVGLVEALCGVLPEKVAKVDGSRRWLNVLQS